MRIFHEPNLKCKALFYAVGLAYVVDGLCLLVSLGEWSPRMTVRWTKALAFARFRARGDLR